MAYSQVSADPGRHEILSASKMSPLSQKKLILLPIMHAKKFTQLSEKRDTLKNSSLQSISWADAAAHARAIKANTMSVE